MQREIGLLFGTAGIPSSSKPKATSVGIKRIKELGLGCMEIEFVQGVKMGEITASEVAGVVKETKVRVSAHAPYFINLNARESGKVNASRERLLQTARIASLCGANDIVFHSAFYLGEPPAKVYQIVRKHLEEVVGMLRAEGNRVWLRPEVTGKASQFGTLEEILGLSAEVKGVAPCIDFAHLHALTGAVNSYQEFAAILEQMQGKLGRKCLDNMHVHVSGIEYRKKGEIRHLNLQESDFQYMELLKALKHYEARGLVICGSPNLEGDALLLQEWYNALV